MKSMNPVIAITMVAAALLVAVEIGASESSATEGPVACWDFNGTVKDRLGDAKDDLSPRGGEPRFVNAGEIPGTLGGAVALGVKSGDAKYLAARASSDVRLGPSYTIEAWIQPTQIDGFNRLVLQWGGGPAYAYHFALHNGSVSLFHGLPCCYR